MSVVSANVTKGLVYKIEFVGDILDREFVQLVPVRPGGHGVCLSGMFALGVFMFIFGKFHRCDRVVWFNCRKRLDQDFTDKNQYF